jgi:Core-2/I-Branching enzyme
MRRFDYYLTAFELLDERTATAENNNNNNNNANLTEMTAVRRRRQASAVFSPALLWSCHLIVVLFFWSSSVVSAVKTSVASSSSSSSSSKHYYYDYHAVATEHDRLRGLLSVEENLFSLPENDGTKDSKKNNDDEDGILDPNAKEASDAAWHAINTIVKQGGLHKRLTKMYSKSAQSKECRAKIAQHVGYFMAALGQEELLPFSTMQFNNTCPEPAYPDWSNLPDGMHIGMVQNRTYQPDRLDANNTHLYLSNATDLRLLYAILTHDDAPGTIRFIEAVYEEGHLFVVHVDAKESSAATYETLVQYAAKMNSNNKNKKHNRSSNNNNDYIYILPNALRQRVNWGGFNMVNATLQMFRFALGLTPQYQKSPLEFHKIVHAASSTYPLASNTEIRHQLASFPLNANLFHVIMKPPRPAQHGWFYFVECDDAMHRIGLLPSLRNETNNMELYTSSQWFIASREFALYLADPQPGTFVYQYLDYIEHVVVADETFFGTVLRNTHFCMTHHNRNYLHLHFDKAESELPSNARDERKCMMKDPNHCGRSPTTIATDYADILELSDDLFARKFVETPPEDDVTVNVKDIIDTWRAKREADMQAHLQDPESHPPPRSQGVAFENQGVLIVAKETVNDTMPLCLGLGQTGNHLRLVPCFFDWVPSNLSPHWETGAVIDDETMPHNRWQVGPCTSDGTLERSVATGQMHVTAGNYSVTGPRCMLKQMDGMRAGRCFDGDTGYDQPGGETLIFPCVHRWGQFLSFGDGRLAPNGSMFYSIPQHIVNMIARLGHEQHPHMCLGVAGRSGEDEERWDSYQEEEEKDEAAADKVTKVEVDPNSTQSAIYNASAPLSHWQGEQIVSTRCTNIGAIVEWVFVPYIVEDTHFDDDESIEAAPDGSVVEEKGKTNDERPGRKSIVDTGTNRCATCDAASGGMDEL